ncbi:MAG: 5-oxoprolinase subunit PxpA [Salinarimonas sp.]|nr:5-oxoprolinase subunit PxpA [Salinarimonas sp.]
MKTTVDLNCDMGEGFGHWRYGDAPDAALMALISSANVATGYHAGDPNLMNEAVALAKAHGVGLGAHPGYKDLQGFGRRMIRCSDAELVNDILYQTGALREFGRRHGIALQHLKLHGALYMEAATNASLSRHLIETLRASDPDLIVFCMHISETFTAAREAGQPVIREFFADRDYDDSGAIVFARKVGGFDPDAIAAKCLRACREGRVATVSGGDIAIDFESICFHSDTPGALAIGQAIRKTLTDNGITIAPAARALESRPG